MRDIGPPRFVCIIPTYRVLSHSMIICTWSGGLLLKYMTIIRTLILGIMVEQTELSVLHSIHTFGDSISPVYVNVHSKVYRRVLMQLRGGTVQFHIETG